MPALQQHHMIAAATGALLMASCQSVPGDEDMDAAQPAASPAAFVADFIFVCGALPDGLDLSRSKLEGMAGWRNLPLSDYPFSHQEELLKAVWATDGSTDDMSAALAPSLHIERTGYSDATQTTCILNVDSDYLDGVDDLELIKSFPGVTGSIVSGQYWRHGTAYSAALSGRDSAGRLLIVDGHSNIRTLFLQLSIWENRPDETEPGIKEN